MNDRTTQAVGGAIDTRLLMTASALFMALLGIGASFFPGEILTYFDAPSEGVVVVLAKIVGALYVGFALLNWMARGNLIGGIYSRPVALGNFVHFLAAAIVLSRRLISTPHTSEFAVGAIAHAIFAGCFGYIIFTGGESCG